MRRSNHYEAAFEHLLRTKGIPYVAVDEAKRALFSSIDLKSFDFIVYLPGRRNLLIDVKGRKAKGGKRRWSFDCWISQSDLNAMTDWQQVFGTDFAVAFTFAFWLAEVDNVSLFENFEYRSRYYRFFAVYLDDYRPYIRRRSDRWNTVTIPWAVFKEIAIEFDELLDPSADNKRLGLDR